MLIKKLVECVSKGGNLLLNVGPDAQGRFPEESLRILKEIGLWMRRRRNRTTAGPVCRSWYRVPGPDCGGIPGTGQNPVPHCRARFGMFIHWGLYAIPARGEWVRSVERIPNEAYDPYRDRVELNSDLFHGGLTPTLGELIVAKRETGMPIMTMVRPSYTVLAEGCQEELATAASCRYNMPIMKRRRSYAIYFFTGGL